MTSSSNLSISGDPIMATETITRIHPVADHRAISAEAPPVSPELGADLARLEREQRIVLDRKRQEELARLRAIQAFD
jgi:hypothetical protein